MAKCRHCLFGRTVCPSHDGCMVVGSSHCSLKSGTSLTSSVPTMGAQYYSGHLSRLHIDAYKDLDTWLLQLVHRQPYRCSFIH